MPPLNNNFSYWYAGVGISYNLDALFKNGKKLKQARLSALKMEEARKLAVEETGNSIHEAYVNLNEAYIRLRTQKKVYSWLTKTLTLSGSDMSTDSH